MYQKLKAFVKDLSRLQRYTFLINCTNTLFIIKIVEGITSATAQLTCVLTVILLNYLLALIAVLKDNRTYRQY